MIFDSDWWNRAVVYISLAAAGGGIGYVMRNLDGKIVIVRVLIEGAAAAFVGFLMLLACNAYAMSDEWTGLIVGVSGWLGANTTIGLLERVVYSRLGLDKNDKSDNEHY